MQGETEYIITALYASTLVTLGIAIIIGVALFICERVLKHTPLKDVLKLDEFNEYEGCFSVLTSTTPLNNEQRLKLWKYKRNSYNLTTRPRTFPLGQ